MPEKDQPSRLLAFDFGTEHIGVATGQTLTSTAQGLQILPAREGQPDWLAVSRLILEWRPDRLLVGLPLNMDGTESEFCRRARKFARRLQGRFGIPVTMIDERLSTFAAKSLQASGNGQRQALVDAEAARLICETWLADPALGLPP